MQQGMHNSLIKMATTWLRTSWAMRSSRWVHNHLWSSCLWSNVKNRNALYSMTIWSHQVTASNLWSSAGTQPWPRNTKEARFVFSDKISAHQSMSLKNARLCTLGSSQAQPVNSNLTLYKHHLWLGILKAVGIRPHSAADFRVQCSRTLEQERSWSITMETSHEMQNRGSIRSSMAKRKSMKTEIWS